MILEKTEVARINNDGVARSALTMDSKCEMNTLRFRMREDRDPEYKSGWPVRDCFCSARIITLAHENP